MPGGSMDEWPRGTAIALTLVVIAVTALLAFAVHPLWGPAGLSLTLPRIGKFLRAVLTGDVGSIVQRVDGVCPVPYLALSRHAEETAE